MQILGRYQSAFVLGLLLLVTLFVALYDFNSYQFGFNPDSADYTLLAHSLLQGPTFGLINPPGRPDPTQYPFGFPLLLTPFVLLAPRAFDLPKILSLAATLSSGVLLFYSWRALAPQFSDRWRIAVTAMFLLAPTTIIHARQVLSEAIFTTFVLLATLLAALLLRTPRALYLWLAFGVALFFMLFTRSVGLVYLVSFGAFFILRFWHAPELRRDLVRGAGTSILTILLLIGAVLAFTPVRLANLIPAQYLSWYTGAGFYSRQTPTPALQSFPTVPTQSQVATLPASHVRVQAVALPTPRAQSQAPTLPTPFPESADESSSGPTLLYDDFSDNRVPHLVDLRNLPTHIHQDLRRMLLLTGGGSFEPVLAQRLNLPWLLQLPGIAVFALLALGNLRWLRVTRQDSRMGLSLFQGVALTYSAVILPWRDGGERLFYPVQPQLYLALLLGSLTLLEGVLRAAVRLLPALRAVNTRWIATGALGVVVVLWLGLALYRDLTLRTSYQAWGNLDDRTTWLTANLPRDAIVMSDWPVLDYLITERRTIPFLRGREINVDLSQLLRRQNVTHLVVALDDSLEHVGIAPYAFRPWNARVELRDMIVRGELVRIHSDAFKVQVFRLEPSP